MGKLSPQSPVRVPAQYRYQLENNDPGSNEPILKGVLTIVGIICLVGALLVGGVFGIVTLCEHNAKAIEAEKVERLEKGLTADVEDVYSKNGIWQFEKFTFEGHAYLWHYQTGIIHLESCPCKNVEEEEKP